MSYQVRHVVLVPLVIEICVFVCVCVYLGSRCIFEIVPPNVCYISWHYNPLCLYFHNLVAGFNLLILEVSRSHTTTRHSR